jgi:hypothetical protein
LLQVVAEVDNLKTLTEVAVLAVQADISLAHNL